MLRTSVERQADAPGQCTVCTLPVTREVWCAEEVLSAHTSSDCRGAVVSVTVLHWVVV